MERISIFNYEAFYLDFLEGNLNEEDTALLMAFLEANPDLKMEDDDLPAFDAEELSLDVTLKNELKQPEEHASITEENAEYFMIASAEGLLDEKKENELVGYVERSGAEYDQNLYKSVYFEPDLTEVYQNKDDLKRKVVLLWRYVSVAAAASVLAFFMIWSSQNNGAGSTITGTILANDGWVKGSVQGIMGLAGATDSESGQDNINGNESLLAGGDKEPSSSERQNVGSNEVHRDRPATHSGQVDEIERRPVGTILAEIDNRNVKPISRNTYPSLEEEKQSAPKNDMALYSEMENPIEPITDFVGEKTNREVDFRRTERNEEGKRGFFVKIGKFEFSRKRN